MSKPTEIIVRVRHGGKHWPSRLLFAVGVQVTIIGVGILADSPAMQWSGFVFLFLILFAAAISMAEKTLTIEEARAKLDELEREGLRSRNPLRGAKP